MGSDERGGGRGVKRVRAYVSGAVRVPPASAGDVGGRRAPNDDGVKRGTGRMTRPARAIIYACAGSWQPAHDLLAEQAAECEAFATRHRMKVVATFEDLEVAGIVASRPGLNAVGIAIASRQADVVIVRDLGRLSRNPKIVEIIRASAASAGVKIVPTTSRDAEPALLCK